MMLSDVFTDNIRDHIIGFNDYAPYPAAEERAKWENIPVDIKTMFVERAEEYLDYEFKPMTASLCLLTGRTDDLSKYDKYRNKKHDALFSLVMAECIEYRGRFMNQIYDCIWSFLDEAVWYRPWKTPMGKIYEAQMVDVSDSFIELAVSGTAYTLAMSYYLLKEKLDAMSLMLFKRLYNEMNRRVFRPYLERKDCWWMAYYRHYHTKMGVLYSINNFTPHCTNLVLEAFCLLESDDERRSKAVRKTMDVLDNYIGFIKDDGWCDEGAGYWEMAYGGLNLVLECIRTVTGGYVDVYDNEKITAMGKYLCNAHIGNGYFVNFADCHPIRRHLSFKIIKYAMNISDMGLLNLAFDISKDNGTQNLNGFEKTLFVLFELDDITRKYKTGTDSTVCLESEYYYNESQVLIARENNDSYKGLFLALKGGHNDENHNHNDAGNFIVYKDGAPVLVDPGVEAYIADTFNTNRYKLWTMQSKYHNLPTFNGVMQKETRKYRAKDVQLQKKESSIGLQMNLADAYERESGLINYQRTVIHDRDNHKIVCSDKIGLKEPDSDIEFSFMTPCKTDYSDGAIKFYSNGKILASLSHTGGEFVYSVEKINFRCEKLKAEWGGALNRVSLKVKVAEKKMNVRFIIQ